jgi:hypothetical protein
LAKQKTFFQDHILEIKKLFEEKLVSQKKIHDELKILYDASQSDLNVKRDECQGLMVRNQKLAELIAHEKDKLQRGIDGEKARVKQVLQNNEELIARV